MAEIEISSALITTLPLADLRIYPNPAKELVTLELSAYKGDFDIKVFDQSGQLLKNQYSRSSLINLDVSDLTAGQYIIRLEDPSGILIAYQKLIKVK